MNSHMTNDADNAIQLAHRKVIKRMLSDPSAARSEITIQGRVGDGLACTVREGKFTAVTDLGYGMGGTVAGPSPGFYARTAIAGCVAIGVKMAAARDGISLRTVDVAVTTDFDDLAIFGLGDSTAAPVETRILIRVDTDVSLQTVSDMIENVLEMGPWFLALRDPQSVVTRLEVG
ncbi:OsmC family protein [Pararhizobium sp. IMCC21322]|uniref:OsmC family protein n=1 Tax=Pararhizobium sp. IMCC21322 TaxID=3067903 RepID=UPI002741F996|nr:OsmC family protein [Pararhizobium sp. IMCC21322]